MKHGRSTRLVWIGAASLVAAAVIAPVGLADKPAKPGTSNSKGVKTFTAKLRGVDGMRGNVVIRLNASGKKVCWSFSNLKLNGQTAHVAHVHSTPANSAVTPNVLAGQIIIPLGTAPNLRRGCATDATWGDEIAAVIASPAAHYVNVHKVGGDELIKGALKKGAPAA